MSADTNPEDDGFPWPALVGALVGVGLIVFAVVSWKQVNEYAMTAHSRGVTPRPLADLTMTLAKPLAPLFERSSGKGSPAAYARAIEATLAAIGLLGAGVVALSFLARNTSRGGDPA